MQSAGVKVENKLTPSSIVFCLQDLAQVIDQVLLVLQLPLLHLHVLIDFQVILDMLTSSLVI